MKTIKYFKLGIRVTRYIVEGVVNYFCNTYRSLQFIRMCSIVNKWPEEIKFPLAIAAIDKE